MKIVVCIGSSCHLKGSRKIAEELKYLIAENKLQETIELSGTFCMQNCQKGVCVTVDGKLFSVSPSETKEFFDKKIMAKA